MKRFAAATKILWYCLLSILLPAWSDRFQDAFDRAVRQYEECQLLTNNIGCMSKVQIEDFANKVLKECAYPHKMKWTTAGDILIGEIIYIDESHINEYPYMAKERVLHEVAHIDTWPKDDRHGELFHSRLAGLIEQFMGRSSSNKNPEL